MPYQGDDSGAEENLHEHVLKLLENEGEEGLAYSGAVGGWLW